MRRLHLANVNDLTLFWLARVTKLVVGPTGALPEIHAISSVICRTI